MSEQLTRMERTVVETLCEDGASNKVIGARLFLTEATIKFHIRHAMDKAGVRTRVALALWWIRKGRYEHAEPIRAVA
jgi:DNA-binding NarL/FixJ family response regulator